MKNEQKIVGSICKLGMLMVCIFPGEEVLADHGGLGFGIGTASPVITQGGITLPKGVIAGGVTTQFIDFKTASTPQLLSEAAAHGDVHTTNTYLSPSVFAAYGLSDNLTLGMRVPYVLRSGVKSPNEDADSINALGSANGFGDVSLFSQYRFFHSDDNLNHASITVGLKTNTGQTGVKNSLGEKFEAHFQPGSGSWNPSTGLSFTRAMGAFSFDTNVLYNFATTGTQQTNLGSVFDYNIAASYAFGAPVRTGLFVDSNNAPWTAILELNGQLQKMQTVAGVADPNEGGNTIYLSPGVRFSGAKNWNTALSIGAPVVTDLNGYQTDPAYRITFRFVAVF
jgi:hypothetical protein